jgi:hypothetical protein
MKIILSFSLFLAALSPLFAQQLDGTFKANSDWITFSGNNISFSLSGFAGLSTVLVGEGTFEIVDHFLIVHTSDFSGEKTKVETLPGTLNDSIMIKVVDNQNFSVQGVFVEARGRSGRSRDNRIEGRVTNNNGTAYLTKNTNISRINISGMGIDNASFDYNSANDYRVTIARNEVIENSTVVFGFNRIDDETISVLLLTTDFNEGRNRDRALESLERRAQRSNRLEKRLRKEYVPFERTRF